MFHGGVLGGISGGIQGVSKALKKGFKRCLSSRCQKMFHFNLRSVRSVTSVTRKPKLLCSV